MRKPTTIVASWLGQILRFNTENEDKYFLSLAFCPKFGYDVCLALRRVDGEHKLDKELKPLYTLTTLFDLDANLVRNREDIDKADILITKLLTGEVEPDQLNKENWKTFCEEI